MAIDEVTELTDLEKTYFFHVSLTDHYYYYLIFILRKIMINPNLKIIFDFPLNLKASCDKYRKRTTCAAL